MRGQWLRADEEHISTTPLPELLRATTGIEPEPDGKNVRLDHIGVRSTQRLAVGELGGVVLAGLFPAELMPQARYLYAHGRGGALLAAARASGWTVEARPHLAFHTALPRNVCISIPRLVSTSTHAAGRAQTGCTSTSTLPRMCGVFCGRG